MLVNSNFISRKIINIAPAWSSFHPAFRGCVGYVIHLKVLHYTSLILPQKDLEPMYLADHFNLTY